jgi:hypothetical protein
VIVGTRRTTITSNQISVIMALGIVGSHCSVTTSAVIDVTDSDPRDV